jgi:hypothetical protein
MTTNEWYKLFENGRSSSDDNELYGCPSASRTKVLVTKAKEIILENH